MKKQNLNVRDIITIAITFVLMFLVYVLVGVPLSSSVYGHLFILSISALIWGCMFIFLYTRISKKGLCLTIGVLLGLVNLINFWGTSVLIILGAIVAEIVWQKADRKKFATMLSCFTIQIFAWFLGMLLPLTLMTEIYTNNFKGYEAVYQGMAEMIMGPMMVVYIAATLIGCVVGGFIGKKVLNKHFIKAGIV